jgi:SAM-dependent methyltransferase
MRDHHRRWDAKEAVEQFANKTAADFFRSETHFLDQIHINIHSVLDIGCAAGRFIALLEHYGAGPAYIGIDVSAASLALARAAYPQATFIEADALDCRLEGRFDLVNATGVCQHEPRFEHLIQRMLEWSARYVLFDVKLAAVDRHLVDIDRAYCGGEDRLYYIVLSPALLLETLKELAGPSRIAIYGYQTPTNARTVVPVGLGPIASVGVLIDKTPQAVPAVEVELPGFLSPFLK